MVCWWKVLERGGKEQQQVTGNKDARRTAYYRTPTLGFELPCRHTRPTWSFHFLPFIFLGLGWLQSTTAWADRVRGAQEAAEAGKLRTIFAACGAEG